MQNNEKIVLPDALEMALTAHLANKQTIRINSAHQWEDTATETAAAAVTTMEIKVPSKDDRLYIITHMAASDDTTGSKVIQLYSVKAGQKHLLAGGTTSAACTPIVWQGELLTGVNQSFKAIFTTPTNSDKLIFTVLGYWVPM